jgi:phosphopantothenoylcysteine decarboxylase/phosphopantothenate--cysteine ligase
VETAAEMADAVEKHARRAHAVVMAAAVADFTPARPMTQKIKKEGSGALTLELSPTTDILTSLGKRKNGKVLVGFALETIRGEESATEKLRNKNLDFIVLNNPLQRGAGFGSDTNIVTIIAKSGKTEKLPRMSKFDVANQILDRVVRLMKD